MHPRLDSLLIVETPEGVSLTLSLAGPLPRVLAFTIDLLIRGALLLALSMLFRSLQEVGQGLFLICLFLVEWLYPVLFEVYGHGSTPGKRMMGVTVMQASGLPVGWSSSLVRNLLRFVDFLPFLYGFGLIAMLYGQHFQRLGDLAAGTVVVWKNDVGKHLELPEAVSVEPDERLPLAEQQILINFAERTVSLSLERQVELADLAEPLTGKTGADGLKRLLGMANFLAGKR